MQKSLILLCIILFGCQPVQPEQQGKAIPKPAIEDLEPKPVQNWTYENQVDKMTGDTMFFASCNSTNTVNFKFPYHGGSTFTLAVRNIAGKSDVVVLVDKGQFMTSFASDEYLRVKFDNDNAQNWSYNSAADASMNMVFPTNSKRLIQGLKGAKKLMIDAPFYDAGRQVMEFDVEGLEWER